MAAGYPEDSTVILTPQNLGLADERATINWYSLPCVWERAVGLL